MRWVYLIILVLIVGAVAIFVVQNDERVGLRFLGQEVPPVRLSLLLVAVYLLGMVTGWSVVGFLKRSVQHVTERQPVSKPK
jgi:uncharacterized membrane protein YciS (DUF1049 family)